MLRRSFLQLVGLATGTAGLLVADPPCPPRNPHCPPDPAPDPAPGPTTSTSTSTTLPPADGSDAYLDAYGAL